MENNIIFNMFHEKINLILNFNKNLDNELNLFQLDYINKIIKNPDFKKVDLFNVIYHRKTKTVNINEDFFLEISFIIKRSYELEKQIIFYHKDFPLTTIKFNYKLFFKSDISFEPVYSESIDSIEISSKTHDFNKVLKSFFILILPSGICAFNTETTRNDFLAVSYLINKTHYEEKELLEQVFLIYDYSSNTEFESIYQLLKTVELYIKNIEK